jgi:hypothetical protein
MRIIEFEEHKQEKTSSVINIISMLTAIADAARPGRSLGSLR